MTLRPSVAAPTVVQRTESPGVLLESSQNGGAGLVRFRCFCVPV